MRFQDKVALITGAATGFGRAFARAFAAEGASVVVIDTDRDGATSTAQEINDYGKALAVECNIADPDRVESMVRRAIDAFGGVDLLVNNAARHFHRFGQPFSKLPREDLRELIDVNVFGTINCSLAVQEPMRLRGGGSIINIGSLAGHRIESAYGVSKLVVRGLTMSFARDFAADGTRVNCVSPSRIPTENAMREFSSESFLERVDHQLVKRVGSIDDVVNAVLYFGSDESSFVTGQTLQVTGGRDLFI